MTEIESKEMQKVSYRYNKLKLSGRKIIADITRTGGHTCDYKLNDYLIVDANYVCGNWEREIDIFDLRYLYDSGKLTEVLSQKLRK